MTPAAGILRFQLARGLGAQSLIRLLDAFRRDGGTLQELASAEPRDLLEHAGLRPQLVSAVEEMQSEAERLAEQLATLDIHILVRGYAPYPVSLTDVIGETAPPLLFARGDLDILSLPGVGFAGSRKSSPIGLTIAREAAGELARRGANIVSGYANGVDLAAHRAALEGGGATTLVLAEGLLNFRTKGEFADVLDSGRYLVLSEFPPALKWLARNAMQRNRTICGLSRALVVIESGLEGGTFVAAETAQKLRLPLFVAAFTDPPPSAEGNAYFLQRGANPLAVDENGRPDLAPLIRSIGVEGDDGEQPGAVAERTKYLFGKETHDGPSSEKMAKKKPKQRSLFEELDEAAQAEDGW
jgi:DNA protecting protein DprA